MEMTGILVATMIVGGVGLFVGLFLGVAAIKFKVEVDEKEEAVLGVLPGNNCGGKSNNENNRYPHTACRIRLFGNTKERTQSQKLA